MNVLTGSFLFQDYVAWTNGQNSIMIGEFDGKDMTNIRMVEHDTQEVSHDIVLHDVGAQPLVESKYGTPMPISLKRGIRFIVM